MSRFLSVARQLTVLVTLSAAASATAQQIEHSRTTAPLRQLPIRFEPTDHKGTFLARGIGRGVRLTGRSIDFPIESKGSIRMAFVGAGKSSRVTGVDPQPGRINYLYGDDPAKWRTNVHTYARAHTSELYRGIDVDYYGATNQLEYDLIVRPGANPEAVRLAISGASVKINGVGDLVYGDEPQVLLRKPVAYQLIAGSRESVAVEYRRRADGTIRFAIGPYDRSRPLVIDPIVAYSFSIGGSGDEQVYDIAVDETGAVYIGGETYSVDFPTVKPAQNRDNAGDPCVFYGPSICRDAFLAKLAADGKSLEYATYFGAAAFDQVNHIAVDSSHALYFTGWTTTATTDPLPDVRNSFIGKLAADGSHFVYTYFTPRCCLGGQQLTINDLAIGTDGSAYVAISTPSTAEIATLSPTGDSYHSLYTLIDPSGTSRTLFKGLAIQGDSLFVAGDTLWSGFPTTPKAYRNSFSGIRVGVVMRLNLTGSVIYSTFLGDAAVNTIADLAVDRSGTAYVVGDTSAGDTTCSPMSAEHLMHIATLSADGKSVSYSDSFPYAFGACLFPAVRIALDDRSNAYTVNCGYGAEAAATDKRIFCVLWKVPAGQPGATYYQYFSDVPSYRFTIDAGGAAKWFASNTGQVSIVKLASQLSLSSLLATPASPTRFATRLLFFPDFVSDDQVEISYWRYDTETGWREVQEFRSDGFYYVWTPGSWDLGDHRVCVLVRLTGSTDTPQIACLDFTITGLAPGDMPLLPPAADFNNDRRPDLLWSNTTTGQLAMWNMGGGTSGERVVGGGYLGSLSLPAGWRVAGTADIDGDGHTDLVLQSDTGLLGAWFLDRSTLRNGLSLTPTQVPQTEWRIRAIGDLNHDGHPDLVWQNAATGQLAFWLMNGTTAISFIASTVSPGADWEVVGVGDSNRDGNLDLFWQQRSTGRLAVWRMQQHLVDSGEYLSASPTDPKWRVVAVMDLDGDGYSDLVLQNDDTGEIGGWYLQGATVRNGLMLNPTSAGDPAWKIAGPR